jgi:hypothetical protein
LYLRLFYTEKYLGWNRENWLAYLSSSLLFAFAVTAMLAVVWRVVPYRLVKDLYTRSNALILYCICLPLTVGLYFMAGSINTLLLPHGPGRMDNFGCCSQGLVFSRSMAKTLVGWYEEKKAGYVDMLTEEYGNTFRNTRWALTPSVIQHVGGKTSKSHGLSGISTGELSEAETIWNFEFERFDPEALRLEHNLAVGGGSRR